MTQGFYDSDLTDAKWQIIEPLLPPPKPVGKDREVDLREVVNAIGCVAKTGGGLVKVVFIRAIRCRTF